MKSTWLFNYEMAQKRNPTEIVLHIVALYIIISINTAVIFNTTEKTTQINIIFNVGRQKNLRNPFTKRVLTCYIFHWGTLYSWQVLVLLFWYPVSQAGLTFCLVILNSVGITINRHLQASLQIKFELIVTISWYSPQCKNLFCY